jgi:hypothetical protein
VLEPQWVQQFTGTPEHLIGPKYKRAVQMLFRMITPRISKSRSIVVRKGIPKDVRADYERLYGQKWEAKLTLTGKDKPTASFGSLIRSSESNSFQVAMSAVQAITAVS